MPNEMKAWIFKSPQLFCGSLPNSYLFLDHFLLLFWSMIESTWWLFSCSVKNTNIGLMWCPAEQLMKKTRESNIECQFNWFEILMCCWFLVLNHHEAQCFLQFNYFNYTRQYCQLECTVFSKTMGLRCALNRSDSTDTQNMCSHSHIDA